MKTKSRDLKTWQKPCVRLMEVSVQTHEGQFTGGSNDEDNLVDASTRGVYHPSP